MEARPINLNVLYFQENSLRIQNILEALEMNNKIGINASSSVKGLETS